jgi:hypothetical protein
MQPCCIIFKGHHEKHAIRPIRRGDILNKVVGYADRFGMFASGLCLVHCLAMPLLLIPLFGLGHQGDAFHRAMVAIVTLPVLLALIPGYLAHRHWRVLALGGLGLSSFVAGVLVFGPLYGESVELVLAVAGGLLLFGAHYRNRHHCACCSHAKAPVGDFPLAAERNIVAVNLVKTGLKSGV